MTRYLAILGVLGLAYPVVGGDVLFVDHGIPTLVRVEGKPWARREGTIECGGLNNYLYAGKALGAGDFHIKARLTILKLANSAASFTLDGESHFGFEGGNGKLFVQGPLLSRTTQFIGDPAQFITDGKPFGFEVVRKGSEIRFLIDGKEAWKSRFTNSRPVAFGFRPWRSTLRIESFSASGDLVDPPPPPRPATPFADVFVSGKDGYHTYRIPSVIVSPKGDLLAFCEGRKKSRSDTGDIDIVMKRSTDGGKTWSAMQVIADQGPHVIGNPCPVVDRNTGTLWMPLTRNRGEEPEGQIMKGTTKEPRTVWLMKSTDDGRTWTKPVDISATTRDAHWRWYATGPGVGIQLERGTHKGRLLIACDHSDHDYGKHPYRSHAIWSDDGGKTWEHSPGIGEKTNECQAVELADGTVLMNMRSYHGKHRRAIATSTDGGATWGDVTLDETLIEPVCQASLLRYTVQPAFAKNRILFSNPASTGRDKMTIRLSYDECKTWPVAKLLYPGSAAYSCLVVLPDHTLGCLFERDGYSKITFARFTLDWLTDGTDTLAPRD